MRHPLVSLSGVTRRFGDVTAVDHRYSMTARQAIELCSLIRPRTVIPVHYEG